MSLTSITYSKCFDLVGSLINRKAKSYLKVPELELMRKIEIIEKSSNALRKLKDNADPAINISIGKKIAKLDSNLMINQWSVAHRSIKNIFREVEIAYVIIKRHKPLIAELKLANMQLGEQELKKAMKKAKIPSSYQEALLESFKKHGSLKKFTEALELETHSQMIRFGNKYHEYALIRYHLEDILEDSNCSNAVCQRNVQTLLERIGISSSKERTRFARIIGDMQRPDMKDVSKLLNENPVALLTRLKKERNYELFAVVRDFILQPKIIDRIFRGMYNLPGFNRVKAVRILRLVYDAQARNLHFPKINRLVRSTLPMDQKLPLLKEINSTVDYDELMVTFARRVDDATADSWKAFKEAAANDQDFLARMVKAEKKAKARGDISLTYEKSAVGKLAAIITAGGSVGYFYFLGDNPDLVEVTEIENEVQDSSSDQPVSSTNDNTSSPDSDENDVIVFSSDEDIEIEGEIESAIGQLEDEVSAVSDDSLNHGSGDRRPSSLTRFNWLKSIINFFFAY